MTTVTEHVDAIFRKLLDGSWGIRVTGPVLSPGTLVPVRKRDGSTVMRVVTERLLVRSFSGQFLYRVVDPGDNTAPLIAPDHTGHEHPIPVVSTDRLFWHAATCTFSSEISELSDVLGGPADAIFLKSARTGTNVLFKVARVEKDREGDTMAWEYHSVGDVGMKLTIFND